MIFDIDQGCAGGGTGDGQHVCYIRDAIVEHGVDSKARSRFAIPGAGELGSVHTVIAEDRDDAVVGESVGVIAEIQLSAGIEHTVIVEGVGAPAKVRPAQHGQCTTVVDGFVTGSAENVKG